MAVIRQSQGNAAILGNFVNLLIFVIIFTAGPFAAPSRGGPLVLRIPHLKHS
jgi:hypothetical protein